MAAVSSSGRAVYEDEMGLAEGSDTSTPIFVPDSKCRWGQGRSLSLSKGRPFHCHSEEARRADVRISSIRRSPPASPAAQDPGS